MYRTALAKSPESPQDGELYWSSWNHANGVYCDGLRAVERLAELHFTSLSAVHGYQDYPEDETKTTMGRWKRQEITPELLAEKGDSLRPCLVLQRIGRAGIPQRICICA